VLLNRLCCSAPRTVGRRYCVRVTVALRINRQRRALSWLSGCAQVLVKTAVLFVLRETVGLVMSAFQSSHTVWSDVREMVQGRTAIGAHCHLRLALAYAAAAVKLTLAAP